MKIYEKLWDRAVVARKPHKLQVGGSNPSPATKLNKIMARYLESRIQQSCVKWFRYQYSNIARLLFAVPNGGSRNRIEASIMKGEGVTAGVSDMILLVPTESYSSLCIELKAGKNNQTDLQKSWQELAEKHGNKYVIVRSFDEFREIIQGYLSHKI